MAVLVLVPFALWMGRFIATNTTGAAGYFILLPLVVVLSIPYIGFGWNRPEDYLRARRLFLFALLVRVLLVAFIDYAVTANTLAPDQVRYHYAGKFLAERWSGERMNYPTWFMNPGNTYHYFVAMLYYVFGANMLLSKLVNAVAGALAVVGVYRITLQLASQRAAGIAAALVTVFPSLMLWSVLGIRDALVVLGLVMSFDALLSWSGRRSVGAAVLLVAGLCLVIWLRGYLANLLVASIVLMALAGSQSSISPRRFIASVSLLVLLVIGLRELGIIEPLVERVSFEAIEMARQNLVEGSSAFGEASDVGTLGSALLHLPSGIAYFMLAPFPWTVDSALQFAALPEVLVWYILIPFVFMGMRRAIEQHGVRLSAILMFVATVTLTYSLVEGNVGTAYRHRAQVLTFFLVFAGIGIDLFLERRSIAREGLKTSRANQALSPAESG